MIVTYLKGGQAYRETGTPGQVVSKIKVDAPYAYEMLLKNLKEYTGLDDVEHLLVDRGDDLDATSKTYWNRISGLSFNMQSMKEFGPSDRILRP